MVQVCVKISGRSTCQKTMLSNCPLYRLRVWSEDQPETEHLCPRSQEPKRAHGLSQNDLLGEVICAWVKSVVIHERSQSLEIFLSAGLLSIWSTGRKNGRTQTGTLIWWNIYYFLYKGKDSHEWTDGGNSLEGHTILLLGPEIEF